MEFVFFFKNSYSRGYNDDNFFKNFTAVDIATTKRGYSDGVPWKFSNSDRRRYSIPVAIATYSCHYSDGLDI